MVATWQAAPNQQRSTHALCGLSAGGLAPSDSEKIRSDYVRNTAPMPKIAKPRPYPANFPGVPISTLARLNGISERHARRLKQRAPPDASRDFIATLTPEMALEICRARPPGGRIPHWSRFAIAHYRAQGLNHREIADLFGVGLRSVTRILGGHDTGGFDPLSGQQALSRTQREFGHSAKPRR